MTRLELLEKVNTLNIQASQGERYWTVTLMYNTVIYKETLHGDALIFEIIGGVSK